jgi:hypothetical protein
VGRAVRHERRQHPHRPPDQRAARPRVRARLRVRRGGAGGEGTAWLGDGRRDRCRDERVHRGGGGGAGALDRGAVPARAGDRARARRAGERVLRPALRGSHARRPRHPHEGHRRPRSGLRLDGEDVRRGRRVPRIRRRGRAGRLLDARRALRRSLGRTVASPRGPDVRKGVGSLFRNCIPPDRGAGGRNF